MACEAMVLKVVKSKVTEKKIAVIVLLEYFDQPTIYIVLVFCNYVTTTPLFLQPSKSATTVIDLCTHHFQDIAILGLLCSHGRS